jgi:hypothetical protein
MTRLFAEFGEVGIFLIALLFFLFSPVVLSGGVLALIGAFLPMKRVLAKGQLTEIEFRGLKVKTEGGLRIALVAGGLIIMIIGAIQRGPDAVQAMEETRDAMRFIPTEEERRLEGRRIVSNDNPESEICSQLLFAIARQSSNPPPIALTTNSEWQHWIMASRDATLRQFGSNDPDPRRQLFWTTGQMDPPDDADIRKWHQSTYPFERGQISFGDASPTVWDAIELGMVPQQLDERYQCGDLWRDGEARFELVP